MPGKASPIETLAGFRLDGACGLIMLAVSAGLAAEPERGHAQTCAVDGQGQVANSAAGSSCAVTPGTSVARVSASNTAQVVVDGVRINVPYNTAATATAGGVITFGVDPTAGGSSIAGGGGTLGLDAVGPGSRISATGLTISLSGGGTTSAKAEGGGLIVLESGTAIQMASGGTQGLWATGAGSQITATGVTITGATGGGDLPVHSQAGASIALTDSTVNLGGASGGKIGLYAETGGRLSADGVALTLAGSGGDAAVSVASGGSASLSGGSVTMSGSGGGETALLAQGAGSTLTADNVPIVVTGTGGDTGVKAGPGATVALTGGSVAATSAADGEKGIWATGGATVTADGVQVSIASSGGGYGVLADTAGVVTLGPGDAISTGGAGSTGLQASGSSSAVTAAGAVTVATTSANATGVGASSGGRVALDGGEVTTSGGGAAGFDASGGAITATGVSASTSGAASPGAVLENGGSLTLSGGALTTSGAGSFGVLVRGAAGPANTLALTDASLQASADAFRVQDASADLTLSGSSAAGSNGVLLTTEGAGVTTLTATDSRLTGAATTGSAATTDMTLQAGSTWNMTGDSNLTNLVNDASAIVIAPPANPENAGSYGTLSVVNYTGAGGRIVLNTYLGTDGSPSDRLVINGGAALGQTLLEIHNTTGPGAETVGDGILVVDAINGATTAAGAFELDGEVREGAFDYHLFRGGLNGDEADDWFLRSDFTVPPPVSPPPVSPPPVSPPPVSPPPVSPPPVSPPPVSPPPVSPPPVSPPPVSPPPVSPPPVSPPPVSPPPVSPPPVSPPPVSPPPVSPPPSGGEEELPEGPPPEILPPGTYPIIGPEIATYAVMQPLARQMGTAMLGTLHERIGDTLSDENTGAEAQGWGRSAWARLFGERIDNRYQAFANPSAKGSLAGVQAGLDVWRGETLEAHYDALGVYFAYSSSSAKVDGIVTNADATAYVQGRTGKVGLEAYSGGAYWTHYGPGGWYLDAVVQGTSYAGRATTQFADLRVDGWGLVTSIEAGDPVRLPLGSRFVLEPQGQLIWQRVSFADADDGLGSVALGSTSGLTGRLGLRAQWTVEGEGSWVWQPYGRVNLWRSWGASATTVFAGADRAPLSERATQLEFAGGVTVKMSTTLSVYAQAGEASAVGSTDGGRRQAVKGDIGLRLIFR